MTAAVPETPDTQFALMMLEIVRDVIKRSGDLSDVLRFLMKKTCQLTSAKIFLVARYLPGEDGAPGFSILGIKPESARTMAGSEEMAQIIRIARALPRPTLWSPAIPTGEAEVLLRRLGCGTSLAVPLMVGNEQLGVMIILGLREEGDIITYAFNIQDTLADVVSLILKHASLVKDLEQSVEERRIAERDLLVTNRSLLILGLCKEALIHSDTEEELLRQICTIITRHGGYKLVWIGYAQDGPEKTVRPMAQEGFEEGYLETVNITWADTGRGRGPTGTAIRTGVPHMASNILTDPDFAPWREAAVKRGYQSSIALPIIYEDNTIGALNLYAAEPEAFIPPEIEMLTQLASDLSFGIMTLRYKLERDRAVRDMTRANRDLEASNRDMRNEIIDRLIAQEEAQKLNEELEERVRERTTQLEAVNKELGEFAYVVSHDLKAPLRAITQLAHWLSQDYGEKLDQEGANMLELLVTRSRRLHHLIEGILTYSRVGRDQESIRPVNLETLMEQIIHDLAPPSHISVTLENPLPTIRANPTRMRQVFQNLLSNAVKFMDKPQGNITIGCASEPRDNQYLFSIRDNGPGIEPRYHDKIFNIFQTLQPRDQMENTGIGLTLVKKIVESYGGSIRLESEPGQGCTFYFTLPHTGPDRKKKKAAEDHNA